MKNSFALVFESTTFELHRIAAICMDKLAGRANFHQARAMQLKKDLAA